MWDTTHDLQTGFPAKLGDKSTFFVSDHWLVHLGWVRRGKPTSEPGPGESGFPRLCMYDLQEQRAAYLGTFSSHVVAVPVGVWAPSGNEPPEVFVFVAQLEKPGASTPSNTALVAVSVPGGTIRPVMSLPGCSHRVALGGAGDTLAIGVRTADNDATDLHIYSESGGQPRVATSISDAVLELEWSPDGKLVLALGVRSLWCFDPATCHLQNLLVDDTKADEACWLGDSKHIIAARGDRLWLIEPESETTKPVFDLNRLGVPGT